MTELIKLDHLEKRQSFTSEAVTKAVGTVKEHVAAIPQDVSTDEGRELVKSTAYSIARTKSGLDKIGKSLGDGLRKELADINEVRKQGVAELQSLQEDFRRPLTEYEEEQKRIENERVGKIDFHFVRMNELLDKVRSVKTHDELQSMTQQFSDAAEFDAMERSGDRESLVAQFNSVAESRGSEITQMEKQQKELEELRKQQAEMRRQQEEVERQKAEMEAEKQRMAEQSKPTQEPEPVEPAVDVTPSEPETKPAQEKVEVADNGNSDRFAQSVDAIEALGFPRDFAEKSVKAIASGNVPNIRFVEVENA